jgi:hypothetical protein
VRRKRKRKEDEKSNSGGLGMKILKVPDWWDSVRAIIAVILTLAVCMGAFNKEMPLEKLTLLKELDLLALTFYFALKKRPEDNGTKTP